MDARGDDGAAEQPSLWGAHDPFEDTAPQPVVPALAPAGAAQSAAPDRLEPSTAAPGRRRSPLAWVAAAVVAILVLGATGVWAMSRSSSTTSSTTPTGGPSAVAAEAASASPSAPSGSSAPLAASQPTLVLGDSLALVVYPYLADLLPDRYVSYVAEVGRSTAKIATALEAQKRIPPVVIVSAGTNDQLASDVGPGAARILAALGPQRCVVWVDVVRPDSYGDPASEVNAAIDAAVAGHPNVTVLRWTAMVAAHPEYLAHDGIHPTEAGVKARAQAYADAAKACSPLDPTAPRAKRQVLPPSVFWGPISGTGSSASGNGNSSGSSGSSGSSTRTSTRSASPSPSRSSSTPKPKPTTSPSPKPSATTSSSSPPPAPPASSSPSAA